LTTIVVCAGVLLLAAVSLVAVMFVGTR
jgi:hypothetical protein